MMRELQEQYGGLAAPSRHGYTWRVDDVAVARCRSLDERFYRIRVLAVPETEPDQAQVGPPPPSLRSSGLSCPSVGGRTM